MDKETKKWALEAAVEIAKEAARGGVTNPHTVLEYAYLKLKELSKDVNASEK